METPNEPQDHSPLPPVSQEPFLNLDDKLPPAMALSYDSGADSSPVVYDRDDNSDQLAPPQSEPTTPVPVSLPITPTRPAPEILPAEPVDQPDEQGLWSASQALEPDNIDKVTEDGMLVRLEPLPDGTFGLTESGKSGIFDLKKGGHLPKAGDTLSVDDGAATVYVGGTMRGKNPVTPSPADSDNPLIKAIDDARLQFERDKEIRRQFGLAKADGPGPRDSDSGLFPGAFSDVIDRWTAYQDRIRENLGEFVIDEFARQEGKARGPSEGGQSEGAEYVARLQEGDVESTRNASDESDAESRNIQSMGDGPKEPPNENNPAGAAAEFPEGPDGAAVLSALEDLAETFPNPGGVAELSFGIQDLIVVEKVRGEVISAKIGPSAEELIEAPDERILNYSSASNLLSIARLKLQVGTPAASPRVAEIAVRNFDDVVTEYLEERGVDQPGVPVVTDAFDPRTGAFMRFRVAKMAYSGSPRVAIRFGNNVDSQTLNQTVDEISGATGTPIEGPGKVVHTLDYGVNAEGRLEHSVIRRAYDSQNQVVAQRRYSVRGVGPREISKLDLFFRRPHI